MKSLLKRLSKRLFSLVLCAVMVASTFAGINFATVIKADAADISLGGITQSRVVGNYEAVYKEYQERFFEGKETNWPTNFIIPGLTSANDYTPQGMTYWEAKEWILISAYDASGSGKHSVIYALDAVTTEFVALFKILNANGTVNTSHGGGIAASEYNFYYADSASKISYFPLSEMDVPKNTVKEIRLRDSIDCAGELGTAKTSYCCYEDGVLWAGNFYLDNDKYDYGQSAHSSSNSMIVGYRLRGNSSEEEWNNLQDGNLIEHSGYLGENLKGQTQVMTFSSTLDDRGYFDISGSVTASTSQNEDYATFGTVYLVEGTTYKLEFDISSDSMPFQFYFIKPGYASINDIGYLNSPNTQYKQNLDENGEFDGTYHVVHTFTPGQQTPNAMTEWADSKGAPVSATYEVRFDQDNVASSHNFSIQNIRIVEVKENYNEGYTTDNNAGYNCAGNPSYVVTIPTVDKIQYAMVSKGKMYISRSWSRTAGSTHTRELMISDIDIGSPGNVKLSINGRMRPCHQLDVTKTTRFGGDKSNSSHDLTRMPYMGEALCVIDDYLYMFTEGAGWNYNGKDTSSVCPEPIDVLWKIDQYAIQDLPRPHEDVASVEYKKVNSLNELNATDEYIILHESPVKDAVTQDNILYLLDAYGGYGSNKLSKKNASSEVTAEGTGNSIGVVGYEIRDYDVKLDENGNVESLILSAEDDANKSLHWQIPSKNSTSLQLENRDLYYASHQYFYAGDSLFSMTKTADTNMVIEDKGNGIFCIKGAQWYNLWCNDGSNAAAIDAYSRYYANSAKTITNYTPNYQGLTETPGTFHVNKTDNPAMATDQQTYFQIYKRIADPFASTYETSVYTDMQAHLQADGTYNITVETYATNNLQYQRAQENRPTDYIFVIDSSGVMDAQDCPTWVSGTGLTVHGIGGGGDSVSGGAYTGIGDPWFDNKYYKDSKGNYHLMYVDATEPDCDKNQTIWVMYYDNGVTYYYNRDNNSWTTAETTQTISGDNRNKTNVYTGTYYVEGSITRLQAIKNTVKTLTDKIAADNSDNRIALVKFGSDSFKDSDSIPAWTNTGMYTNSGSFVQASGYDTISKANLQSAFFKSSQFTTVKNLVDAMSPLGHNFPSYGLDMASDIISNSDAKYDATGNRSAVVIVLSSGTPGYITEKKKSDDVTKATADRALGTEGAYSLKRNGAHVYTILFGNGKTKDNFDLVSDGNFESNFMTYLSSNYTGSKSMSDYGPVNDRENVNYFINIGTAKCDLEVTATSIISNVNANSNVAIASLGTKSVLSEEISDAFDLTGATVTCQLAPSKYDGIGRLYFGDANAAPSTITASTVSNSNRILTVTGFDYSENNVSEYNSNSGHGNKLIVTISGVTANTEKTLTAAPINVQENTAIYEDETRQKQGLALKTFQQYYFAIPEYTYYMDYDIPMYDNDVNGTLVSVDSLPQKQSTYKDFISTGNMGIEFANGKQDLIYTLNSQGALTEDDSRGYVLIQRDDGTYDWFRLNIVPASTVYYEENKMETLTGTSNYTGWTEPLESAYEGKYQSLSGKNDVFGSDETYANSTSSFSLGTNKNVTVSPSANRSDTQTFTFTGEGFDIYSACGSNTGIQTVTVRDHKTKQLVNVYLIDTYYNDSNYKLLTQVPILHYECNYGTYDVEITAAYYSFAGGLKTQSVDTLEIEGTDIEATSAVADIPSTDELFAQVGMDELIGQEVEVIWMDENSIFNGGTGAESSTLSTQAGEEVKTLINYIDGFRIYNTKDYDDEYIESEQNASYYNVIDAIADGQMGGNALAAYIEPGATGELTFANYLEKGGPQYEVYLAANQSIAFRFKTANDAAKAMISLRAASGAPTAKVNTANFTVKSASETYYNITGYLGSKDADGCYTVTITNTGSGLLAVDNIKITNAELASLSEANLAEINARILTQSVEVDPFAIQSEVYTYVDAPDDNPFIDPEGSIPDIEDFINNNGEGDSVEKTFFEIVVDFFRTIIERIKEVLQALPVLWTKTIKEG